MVTRWLQPLEAANLSRTACTKDRANYDNFSVAIDFPSADKTSSRCMYGVRKLGEDQKSVISWSLWVEAPPRAAFDILCAIFSPA